MSGHTPGPWTFGYDGHGGVAIETDDCDGVQIGFVSRGNIENARLIAAAPELLEALRGFVAEFGDKSVNANVRAARSAIAKATQP